MSVGGSHDEVWRSRAPSLADDCRVEMVSVFPAFNGQGPTEISESLSALDLEIEIESCGAEDAVEDELISRQDEPNSWTALQSKPPGRQVGRFIQPPCLPRQLGPLQS